MATNYLKLNVADGKGVFEYEVVFEPRIDNRDQRFRLLNQQRGMTGPTKSFDGTKLFLPMMLDPPVQSGFSERPENGDQVKVKDRNGKSFFVQVLIFKLRAVFR